MKTKSPLPIERLLQFSIAALAAMGTFLLGMGSDNILLPAVAIVVAVSSLYLTDIRGWVRLNRNIASVAAVGAVVIAVFDFFQLGRERQLLAIAYLLIYLQIVLMYQRKDIRVYWQLLMLSLLQVVVASALNFNLTFGLMLTVYMFMGLFALSVFFVYRERLRHQRRSGRQARAADAPAAAAPDPAIAIECGNPAQGLFQRGLRWRVLLQGLATLVLTFTAFLLLPRAGDTTAIRRVGGRRMIGFTETVQLGELGNALQNPQSVMRVWFLDNRTRQPYSVHGEPFFRGTIVNHYENGSWSLRTGMGGFSEDVNLLEAPPGAALQKISLEPQAEATVFGIYPIYVPDSSAPVAFNLGKQQIVRLTSLRNRLDVTLATTGIHHGLQTEITPRNGRFERAERRQRLQPFGDDDLFPDAEQPLQPVREIASRVISASGARSDDVVGRARALESYLRDSGRFQYTLTAQDRDRNVDPIVDFLAENRRGHCEYFATALALMLRSQGIPSRVVIGYKGGEWNSLGGYYQVRQLHAHSWTEALVPKQQIAGMDTSGWLRLDPTPGSSDEDDPRNASLLKRVFGEWTNYSEYLWSNYVVDLDAKRQREGIYAPLAGIGEFIQALFTRQFWAEDLPKYFKSQIQSASWAWLSSRGVLIVMLTILTGSCLVLVAQKILRMLRSRRPPPVTRRTLLPRVEFYQRLEAILKQHGLVRPASQTQHEFAVAVGGHFAESPSLRPLASLPRRVVEAYYGVCYGATALDNSEIEAINHALQQLASQLKARRAKGEE